MTHVKPGRAAAAEMTLGTRAAQAGVGLCTTCRHPVRLHGDLGCTTGECWCSTTGAELRSGVPVEASPVPALSAAELARLDVHCKCGHTRTSHAQRPAGSGVPCGYCKCRQFHAGGPDASVTPPAEPTPPPVAAAPAPAAPPAAAPEPVGEPPAPRPVADRPPWLPGAGVPYVKPTPAPVVAATPDVDVARQVDDIVAAGKAAPYRRPRLHTARPAAPALGVERAADGEPDAVEEVAVAMCLSVLDTAAELLAERGQAHWDPPRVSVRPSPSPFDFEPFLARALYVSARWYCPRCHQWPLDPGACPGCHKTLQAVYHVTIPRSVA